MIWGLSWVNVPDAREGVVAKVGDQQCCLQLVFLSTLSNSTSLGLSLLIADMNFELEELIHVLNTLIYVVLLQLWVKIVDGDIQDSTRSDLYDYIVDFLTFCSDQELVWKYSEWILQKNEEVCD